MSAPVYSAEDFVQAMAALLPRGAAWPREQDSTLMRTLRALAPTYARSGAAAANLIPDVSPASTENFVVEWEETLGLPDACSPPAATLAQRKAAILAKFIAAGGQSVPYLEAVALALGFAITITELPTPYHWQVNAPSITPAYFMLGQGSLNDFFWTIGNSELECRLRAIMPAHTVLTFHYS